MLPETALALLARRFGPVWETSISITTSIYQISQCFVKHQEKCTIVVGNILEFDDHIEKLCCICCLIDMCCGCVQNSGYMFFVHIHIHVYMWYVVLI
jgi:hypothetical protein